MRYFAVKRRPTREQLAAIDGVVLNVDQLVPGGGWLVGFDMTAHAKPAWMDGAREFQIPGEPMRCRNCGELI